MRRRKREEIWALLSEICGRERGETEEPEKKQEKKRCKEDRAGTRGRGQE